MVTVSFPSIQPQAYVTKCESLFLDGLQHLEGAHERVVNGHHGTSIVEFTTVVWSTEEGNQLTLRKELVPIFYDLVRTTNEVEVMLTEER